MSVLGCKDPWALNRALRAALCVSYATVAVGMARAALDASHVGNAEACTAWALGSAIAAGASLLQSVSVPS